MKITLLHVVAKPVLNICVFGLSQNIFAGDISFFAISKEQKFSQTNNAAPISNSSFPFSFQCMVSPNESALIIDASLQLPSGGSRILKSDGGYEFGFDESFISANALNSTYGTGIYSLVIDSENDFNVAQITMPSDAYPPTPQIQNYTEAQAINSSNDFTLTWLSFVGGTTNDYIELSIRDSSGQRVFQSGNFGSPSALNGTNVSILLPANTFSPGETYRGELMFAHPTTIDSTSIPGATGVVAFLKHTRFDLKTTGTAPAINLHLIGITNGNFQFSFNTQPGKSYQVQFTETLTNWQNIGFFNATSNQIIFSDPFSSSHPGRMFRVFTP